MDTVIGVPVIKEWDCAGRQTMDVTVGLLKTVYALGGLVQFLEMDEPLVSALGLNFPICKLDFDEAAADVAAYAKAVTTEKDVVASGVIPQFVDVEAYPSVSVENIKVWIAALARHGFKPEAFHLDANVQLIEMNPTSRARLRGDLLELQLFLKESKISFGIIVWSGHDPERSDEDYYVHAMNWVRIIYDSIGKPDRVAFESWVKRCTKVGPCTGPNLGCSGLDAYDVCGTNSVPRALPESGQGIFSHTHLITEAIGLLNSR